MLIRTTMGISPSIQSQTSTGDIVAHRRVRWKCNTSSTTSILLTAYYYTAFYGSTQVEYQLIHFSEVLHYASTTTHTGTVKPVIYYAVVTEFGSDFR